MSIIVPNPAAWPFRNPDFVYADDLNLNIRDVVSFLATERPTWAAVQGVAQTLVSENANQAITMDTVIADTAGGFADSGDASKYIIQAPGWYLIGGQVSFASNSPATNFACGIMINGTNHSSLGTGFWGDSTAGQSTGVLVPGVMDLVHCNIGDVIQIAGYQWSGSSINTRIATGVNTQYLGYYVAADNPGWPVPAAVPSPRTWASTDLVNPATADGIMTAELQTTAQYLLYPPIFLAQRNNVQQSIPANTVTTVTLPSTIADNVSAWNSGTATWTCKRAGVYVIGGTVCVTAPTAYDGVQCLLNINGSNYLTKAAGSNSTWNCDVNVWMMWRFAVNDTLQLQTFCNQALQTGTGPNITRLWTAWMAV